MSLIIIVISLIAERFLLDHQQLRELRWIDQYSQWLERPSLPSWMQIGVVRLLILLLPPVLLIGILQQRLGGSLIGMVFSSLVLLYTLGPKDIASQINRLV